MRIRMLLIAGATAALMAAGTAIGAPDKTFVLTAATPEFNWDGEQGQYTNLQYDEESCQTKETDSYCELILLDVRSDGPVTLDASLTEFSNPFADFDLRIYKSNSAGTFTSDDLVQSAAWDPVTPGYGGPNGVDEVYHVEGLAPGLYMLAVSHYFNPNATYKGNVKITGATGGGATPPPATGGGDPGTGGGGTTPPPSGGGGGTTPPAQTDAGPLPFKVPGTLGSAKKAKKSKALSFKATASEAISNLTVSLVDKKKKVIGKATVASFPKGSKTIKLKVKKLKPGKYNLVSSGTVNGANRVASQAVKVKK